MNDNGDSLTSGQATTDDGVSAVTIKLPPFWRRRPDLWFLQAESQFELRRITRERTKYNYVIGALDVDSMEQVSDIVSQPPGENCYEQMKAKLISIFSDSEEAKIRQLLQELELGDQKPSQLWRKMKDLAQNRLTDEILKTLWLQRLPTSVQQVLTGNKEAMTSLIITADRIVEITDSRPQVNAAVSGSNPEIARLVQAIENLVSRMNQLEAQPRRSRSRSRPDRSQHRRHRSSTPAQEGLCFYHSTYGDKARKCESPCSRRQPPKN
ncbi:unnamed protein product [Nesidiocoris tenuis]|uniref:DUF7041 domain-containing protein n=1 Tax=Nesidiocoris tenuis TaxID=355587 RepID=A0A6H5HWD8_9HEMI|nr:unnamed protein product [Nesidiocoris tenuis]